MTGLSPYGKWSLSIVVIVLAISAVLFAYGETSLYLYRIWTDFETGEYAHGFMVVAMSAYMIWQKKAVLEDLRPEPALVPVIFVLCGSVLWVVATTIDVNVGQAFALLVLVASVVWAVFGHGVMRVLWFPVGFILFALPIWFPISPLLQDITADVVFTVIRWIEVPAYRQHNLIIVPAGTLSIEEACSGLRYFLAGLTLSVFYAYLYFESMYHRMMVILVTAAVSIIANFIRVFIVVYLGYATDMQHPWVEDHLSLGWYVFAALIFMLLMIEMKMGLSIGASEKPEAQQRDVGGTDTGSNMIVSVTVVTSIMVAILVPVIMDASSSDEYVAPSSVQLTSVPQGWESLSGADAGWHPEFNGAVVSMERFLRDGHVVSRFVAYYRSQEQGRELINDKNSIISKVNARSHSKRPIRVQAGDVAYLQRRMIGGSGDRVVRYWYVVSGVRTTNVYVAKLLQLKGLVDGDTSAYVVALAHHGDADPVIQSQILDEYTGSMDDAGWNIEAHDR